MLRPLSRATCALYTPAFMPKPLKPPALAPGSTIAVVSPASSAKQDRVRRGCDNLEQLDYRVQDLSANRKPDGYFSGSFESRLKELQEALTNPDYQAVFCSRGGYGSAELLEQIKTARIKKPKVFCAFSDLTSLHIFLWQKLHWVTFYGPLIAGGFDAGANATGGYDPDSFMCAMTATHSAWSTPLRGETLVRGIVLGEFPESEPPEGSPVGVRGPLGARQNTIGEVCQRILGPLQIPIVYGAPIGHTPRPMLTLPLGVHARLHASGEGHLEILEPAVRP